MRTLPLGTAYTVWTGSGALGDFLVGLLWLGEAASPMRLTAAAMIVTGLVIMTVANPSREPPARRVPCRRIGQILRRSG